MYNNYDMFDKKSLKIVFMGTPSIAAKVFLDMINDGKTLASGKDFNENTIWNGVRK